MKKSKIVVIGTYGKGNVVADGQINKVRDYYTYISEHIGDEYVKKIDVGLYKNKPLRTLIDLIQGIKWCDKIVLLLCGDGNGIKIIFPFIIKLAKRNNKELFFSVVGGGMLNDIDQKGSLIKRLKSVDVVYVETKKMVNKLKSKGLDNIKYAPVFSKRQGIEASDIPKTYQEPYRLCTYARVIKEKGITDAIDAVIDINNRLGRKVCILDIYGDPTKDYEYEFKKKIAEAGEYVKCNPLLDDTNAIQELSKHYLLLFPTYYKGEGFPIALVESMKAGVPVIATDWHFNSEIIDDGRTGKIYKRDGEIRLSDIIINLINDSELVYKMKIECIREAKRFEPNWVLADLYEQLER